MLQSRASRCISWIHGCPASYVKWLYRPRGHPLLHENLPNNVNSKRRNNATAVTQVWVNSMATSFRISRLKLESKQQRPKMAWWFQVPGGWNFHQIYTRMGKLTRNDQAWSTRVAEKSGHPNSSVFRFLRVCHECPPKWKGGFETSPI